MRRLLMALFVCLFAAPALAVDPPDYGEFGPITSLYNDGDGTMILMRERNFRIDKIDGKYYGTVRQTVAPLPDGTPQTIDRVYPLGCAVGSDLPNKLDALASAEGTVITLKYFWAVRAQDLPIPIDGLSYNVLEILPLKVLP